MIPETLRTTQALEFLLQALEFLDKRGVLCSFILFFFPAADGFAAENDWGAWVRTMEGGPKYCWTLNPAISVRHVFRTAGARSEKTSELSDTNALVLNPVRQY